MDFFTFGKQHYKDFSLPLCYTSSFNATLLNENSCYQIIYSPESDLLVKTAETTAVHLAPIALLVSKQHKLEILEKVQDGLVHHFVFKPSALNDPEENDWIVDDIGKQFYFKPFCWDRKSGFFPLSLHENQKYRFNQLCLNLDSVLNKQEESESWPCLSRSYFLEILILIQRSYFRKPAETDLTVSDIPGDIQPVLEYLLTHYHQTVSVDDIAGKFGTNRTTLNKLIRDYTGYSSIQFLHKIRCDVARSLLRKTHLSISEISRRVGIEETSYFSRFFRKQIGCSPLEYRAKHPDPYCSRLY